MPRRTEAGCPPDMWKALIDAAPGLDDKARVLAEIRSASPELSGPMDRLLLEESARLRAGLLQAQEIQKKLKEIQEKLTSPPWHEAVYLEALPGRMGRRALVLFGGSRRVVGLADELDPGSLESGTTVFLNDGLNMVMEKSPLPGGGETAFFERRGPEGRAVLRWRDEEVLVNVGDSLRAVELHSRDQVRWDRRAWMAYEKIERSRGDGFFLEEAPQVTFEDIGGLDREIEELKEVLVFLAEHPELAKRYGLERLAGMLLIGPPGIGKTMLARATANFLSRISKSRRSRFINIKPASLHSMWYSQSEANYREVFRIAREAGEEESIPVVLFFDEVDSIGAARGQSLTQVDDRVLLAFAAELDGLRSRGNVVVMGATNRPEALDPALARPGRLGDKVLMLRRPDRKSAVAIFDKHLARDLPYAGGRDGRDGGAIRQEIIEAAASRIYSPNGDGDLATITFRDGKRRPVRCTDLISGAAIANVARAARRQAALREVKTGQAGIALEDVLDAIADEFHSAVRALTRSNCHLFISDLPQDLDVVGIKPAAGKVRKPHRLLSLDSSEGP